MGRLDRGIEIVTGRRSSDGRARLSVFGGDMLAFTVEGQGLRAPTLLLTREQATALRQALGEMIPLLKEAGEPARVEKWRGAERRTTGELK